MWLDAQRRPSSACFKKKPQLSGNWARYSGVEHTRNQDSAAVVSFTAGTWRSFGQEVRHSPIEPGEPFGPNQAHAEVIGEKDQVLADRTARRASIEWVSGE
jgi:hypothetical protein